MSENKKQKGGFIALISVIIISAILLLIVVTLSTSSLFERYDILGSELKDRSLANAEACVDEGLLSLANGENHYGTTTTQINTIDSCVLGPIPTTGNPRIFYVKSNFSNYITNLKISVNPNTISVVSWEEIGTY